MVMQRLQCKDCKVELETLKEDKSNQYSKLLPWYVKDEDGKWGKIWQCHGCGKRDYENQRKQSKRHEQEDSEIVGRGYEGVRDSE